MSWKSIPSAPSSETTHRQTHGGPVQLINHRLRKIRVLDVLREVFININQKFCKMLLEFLQQVTAVSYHTLLFFE